MVDAAVTWKAEIRTYFVAWRIYILPHAGLAFTLMSRFLCSSRGALLSSSFWLVLSRTPPDFYLASGLSHDMSRAVLKDLVSHPETVHPAVYAVIVLGSVIGFAVVCVIACLCRLELASRGMRTTWLAFTKKSCVVL